MCAYEYVKNAIAAIYLINNEYMPYYKWQFRGLKELDILSHLALPLEFLVTAPNDDSYVNEKYDRIELIATEVNALTYLDNPEVAEGHVYAVAAVWAEGESNLSNDYVSEFGPTGINEVTTVANGDQKVYNAAGQRTGMSQHGFRIVTVDNKTRKVVVK